MKILLVSDFLDNCSVHNRCKMLQKYISEHSFDIVDENFEIQPDDYDLIHINYSIGAEKYLDLVKQYPNKFMLTVCNERSIFGDYKNDDYFQMIHICQSTALSKRVADCLKIAHIGNGFNEDVFKRSKKAVVGYVGTQQKNKNHKIIKQVCEDLDLEFKPQYYENRIPAEQMNEYYLGLDVYVHASLTEGFSCVCLEALACNIPVIMTRVGNWEEYIGLATFIEPTYESLYMKLIKYSFRKLVGDKYFWSVKAREYATIYKEIDGKLNRTR